MAQNPDPPVANEQELVLTEEKEEPVEVWQRDVLEEDDDFEEFKEDRRFSILEKVILFSIMLVIDLIFFVSHKCCRLGGDRPKC